MKRLPIFSVVLLALIAIGGIVAPRSLALFQTATSGPAEPAGAADAATPDGTATHSTPMSATAQEAIELLQRSRDRLLTRHSVRANLRETVSIGDSNFEVIGTYLAGPFPRLRLSYEVQVGATTGHLLEVCDGQVLWTIQELHNDKRTEPVRRITRTVIDQLLEAESPELPETLLIAHMGVGGLPALIAGLERSMTFDTQKVIEHEGERFTVIEGRWNDEYLTRFGVKDGAPLPAYVPDRVRIYFHKETLFPSRILYRKRAALESQHSEYRTLLSLEFSDVVLDEPVLNEEFLWVPPSGAQVENRTTEYLELIKAIKERAVKPRE